MALGRDEVGQDGANDSSETEALLNNTWSSDERRSSSTSESMTSRIKASWSSHREKISLANNVSPSSDDGPELALENLRDSQDLDNANLRAQGHEAALQRRFSPLAALGLGFRYIVLAEAPARVLMHCR